MLHVDLCKIPLNACSTSFVDHAPKSTALCKKVITVHRKTETSRAAHTFICNHVCKILVKLVHCSQGFFPSYQMTYWYRIGGKQRIHLCLASILAQEFSLVSRISPQLSRSSLPTGTNRISFPWGITLTAVGLPSSSETVQMTPFGLLSAYQCTSDAGRMNTRFPSTCTWSLRGFTCHFG